MRKKNSGKFHPVFWKEKYQDEVKDYIIEKVLCRSKDVKDILKVRRLAKNKEGVDRIISVMYGEPS